MSGRPGWRKRSAARGPRLAGPAAAAFALELVAAFLGTKGPLTAALERQQVPPAPEPKRKPRDLGEAEVVE